MIARMTARASKTAVGSVGMVETQFLDLPQPLALDCGRELHPVRIAYETYGTLSANRDNVILVCHALSGDAHAAGLATAPTAGSTRDAATGRPYGADFPVITVADMVRTERAFLNELGITRLAAALRTAGKEVELP